MTSIAVQRDDAHPRKATRTKPTNAAAGEQTELVPQTWADVLVRAIPTEILALYTVVIGVVVGTIEEGKDELLTFRWAAYFVTAVAIAAWLIVAYRRKRISKERKYPLAETTAAVIAFAAWGLVMPGSPLAASLDSAQWTTIWTITITAVGVLFLGLLGIPLKGKVK